MNRLVTAAVALFVVVVIALWVRRRSTLSRDNERLASIIAAARSDDEERIGAIRTALSRTEEPSQRPCHLSARAKIVRLERVDSPGGRLHDVIAAVAEQREPDPWRQELDVVEGRAFLFDYASKRLLCVGKDAEDPHGTLVGY